MFSRRLAVAVLMLAQTQPTLAAIVNDAVATGSYQGVPVLSEVSSASVEFSPAEFAFTAAKTGTYQDSDTVPGTSAGDTIFYTVSVTNTGNVPLTGVRVTDPMIEIMYTTGDAANPGSLDPGETWIHTGTYVLTDEDIATEGRRRFRHRQQRDHRDQRITAARGRCRGAAHDQSRAGNRHRHCVRGPQWQWHLRPGRTACGRGLCRRHPERQRCRDRQRRHG